MHTLGGFFWEKEENTYSWKMCVSYTKITGNVKSKHKQYDHWHSQDFSTGGKATDWGNGGVFLHIKFFCLVSPANQWGGGGGAGPLYPLIATPVTVHVARIC